MDKAIVKYLHERGEDPRGVADGVDNPCMEKKGDVHDPEKYQGIKLLSHVLINHSHDHFPWNNNRGFWMEG